MAGENPFDSPKESSPGAGPSPAQLLRTVLVVFGCALLGGLFGLGIGAALGSFVPSYYRSVFPGGADPHFDPVAVGIGQGFTQGVVFGGVVGLALVAIFYWYRLRSARGNAS